MTVDSPTMCGSGVASTFCECDCIASLTCRSTYNLWDRDLDFWWVWRLCLVGCIQRHDRDAVCVIEGLEGVTVVVSDPGVEWVVFALCGAVRYVPHWGGSGVSVRCCDAELYVRDHLKVLG